MRMDGKVISALLKVFPKTYSEELGINLELRTSNEIFKWFLAALLFGKPIRESSAIKTYKCFINHGLTNPEKILAAGWGKLVEILDEGGYTRYDFSTADKLLKVMRTLVEKYHGDLNLLHRSSKDLGELKSKLKDLGKGIGDVTIQIFLRELRETWNVEVELSKFTILAAEKLKLIESTGPSQALKELKEIWDKYKVEGKSFANLETALLRLGKNYCRKNKCSSCPVKDLCVR